MKSLRIILTMSTLLSSNIILSEHYGYNGGESESHNPRSHQRRSKENDRRQNRGNRDNKRSDNHRSRHNRNFYNEE